MCCKKLFSTSLKSFRYSGTPLTVRKKSSLIICCLLILANALYLVRYYFTNYFGGFAVQPFFTQTDRGIFHTIDGFFVLPETDATNSRIQFDENGVVQYAYGRVIGLQYQPVTIAQYVLGLVT